MAPASPISPPSDAPPASAPPASSAASPVPDCELHVWPAARVSAVTQGVGSGFGLVGALVDAAAHADQNKRDTAFITAALDAKAQAQAQVLRDLDLPAKMNLPPSEVVIHDEGVDIKSNNKQRLTTSSSKCYAELVVRELSFFQNPVYKPQIRTFLQARRFEGDVLKSDFRDSKHEDLTVKLPAEGEDTGPATDSLLTAFRGDVAFFADKYAKKYK